MNEITRLQTKAQSAHEIFTAAESNPAVTNEEANFFRQEWVNAQNAYADYADNDWLAVN